LAILFSHLSLPSNILYYITHPSEFLQKLSDIKDHAKTEAKHYWMGTKLLMAEIRTARKLMMRTLSGSPLTRRERKQVRGGRGGRDERR